MCHDKYAVYHLLIKILIKTHSNTKADVSFVNKMKKRDAASFGIIYINYTIAGFCCNYIYLLLVEFELLFGSYLAKAGDDTGDPRIKVS